MLEQVQKSISAQISESVFVERVERVARKTKFEPELMKLVDCVFDGFSSYENNLVSFKI